MPRWLAYYVRQYFGFSRRETYATLLMLGLLLLVIITVPCRRYYLQQKARNWCAVEGAHYDKQLAALARRPLWGKPLAINRADVRTLQRRCRVSPKLAKRIIAYRDRLGGFVNTTQYEEVQGIPKEVVTMLKGRTCVDVGFVPRQINVNSATIIDLASHPYFSYQQACHIVRYREQHGLFKSVQDLKQSPLFSKRDISIIAPYLCCE